MSNRIDVTNSVRDAVKKLKRLPRSLETSALEAFRGATEEIKRIMQRPGLPPIYPIRWDSLKQKIFVILKLKRENNLPYERTNERVRGWKTEQLPDGYAIKNIGNKIVFLNGTVTGTLSSAQYVQESGQSHIFEGTWRLFRPVLDSVLSRLPERILKNFRIEGNG